MCRRPNSSRWYRQIFENEKSILSCGRIMSMLAFGASCVLVVLYVLGVFCIVSPRGDKGIAEFAQYFLIASFAGLILNKYVERLPAQTKANLDSEDSGRSHRRSSVRKSSDLRHRPVIL